jgi:hypothetical protein
METKSDNHSVTEAGWHIERYVATRLLAEDYFKAKYITVEESGVVERGGFIVRETTAQWVLLGHIVYAIIAEFDKTAGKFKPAVNPFWCGDFESEVALTGLFDFTLVKARPSVLLSSEQSCAVPSVLLAEIQ